MPYRLDSSVTSSVDENVDILQFLAGLPAFAPLGSDTLPWFYLKKQVKSVAQPMIAASKTPGDKVVMPRSYYDNVVGSTRHKWRSALT
jgi:hypothetical protein